MKAHERVERSIVKTITYRVLLILAQAVIVYGFTGSRELTIGLTTATNAAATVIYFFHERAWNAIHFGKEVKK
jgi:uncharacterized membrane protein